MWEDYYKKTVFQIKNRKVKYMYSDNYSKNFAQNSTTLAWPPHALEHTHYQNNIGKNMKGGCEIVTQPPWTQTKRTVIYEKKM